MVEAAAVPRRVVGRPLHHAAPGRDRRGVGKDAPGPVHVPENVHHRQVREGLRPVHSRHLGRQVVVLRHPHQVLAGEVRREARPLGVLVAVEPGDEQHLDRAAAIPVPLLVEGAHAPHAGAESLGHHGGVGRVVQRREAHLPLGGGRATQSPDLAVGPPLRRNPGQGVITVGDRRSENVPFPLREELAALVLHHVGVAPGYRLRHGREVARLPVAHIPVVEVVGGADEDRRHRAGGVPWPIHIGGEPDAVPHGHHHLPLDDGDGCDRGCGAAGLLCAGGATDRDGNEGQRKDEAVHGHAPAGGPEALRGPYRVACQCTVKCS